MKSSYRRPGRGQASLAALVASMLVLACGLAGPGTSPAPASPSVPPATASPAPPTAPPTEGAEPPDAQLKADGSGVAGLLGTYCWLGTCADLFEIPSKSTLPQLNVATPNQGLTFSMGGGAAFLHWDAAYGPGSMDTLAPLDEGGQDFDPDTSATPPPSLFEASVTSPPSGDWVVYIVARSLAGEAHYMWHVVVP